MHRQILNERKGFTLIEVLIAVSLFTIAAIISSNILVDVVQLEKKTSISNAIYEDARIILQQLTRTIQSGTIDYEEYYSMYVIQDPDGGRQTEDGNIFPSASYGVHYGVYGSRFFDPGRDADNNPGENPKDLGVLCSYYNDDGECEILFTNSADLNTGQHPFDDPNNGDVLCEDGPNVGKCGDDPYNILEELYIIDSTGTKKTIIGRKKIQGNNYGIGMIEMEGHDLDQNGIVDIFSCKPEYNCYGGPLAEAKNLVKYYFLQPFIQDMEQEQIDSGAQFLIENNVRIPQKSDLEDAFLIDSSQFIPISPLRSNIKQLYFQINPVEDPYKGYADTEQVHPSVTIFITIGLSDAAAADYPGTFTDIKIQTTVAAGVIGQVESYPPVNDILVDGADKSWICNILPNSIDSNCP